jgi:hypothetical protein
MSLHKHLRIFGAAPLQITSFEIQLFRVFLDLDLLLEQKIEENFVMYGTPQSTTVRSMLAYSPTVNVLKQLFRLNVHVQN